MKQCWFHDWAYAGYTTLGRMGTTQRSYITVLHGERMVHFKKCRKCGTNKQVSFPQLAHNAIRVIAKDTSLGYDYHPQLEK